MSDKRSGHRPLHRHTRRGDTGRSSELTTIPQENFLTILRTLSGQPVEVAHGLTLTSNHALESGRNAALDAMDSLRSNSRQLRNALLDTRDGTLRYMRHEPAKSVMIAAAAGIVVLGLAVLLAQLRRRH